MREFRKGIYRIGGSDYVPPSYYTYDISRGTQICNLGYVDIGGTITTVSIFSTIVRTAWTDGTLLYTDNTLTTPLADGFYRSVTGGTVDLFFFNISSGAITGYTPPMTGC